MRCFSTPQKLRYIWSLWFNFYIAATSVLDLTMELHIIIFVRLFSTMVSEQSVFIPDLSRSVEMPIFMLWWLCWLTQTAPDVTAYPGHLKCLRVGSCWCCCWICKDHFRWSKAGEGACLTEHRNLQKTPWLEASFPMAHQNQGSSDVRWPCSQESRGQLYQHYYVWPLFLDKQVTCNWLGCSNGILNTINNGKDTDIFIFKYTEKLSTFTVSKNLVIYNT